MHLVLQGPAVESQDLTPLARLTGARGITQTAPNVFRLLDATPHPAVAAHCAQSRLDFAFVPETRHLSQIRLVAMDMDSTLIGIECIDEIADLCNLKPQVAAITAAAMRGEIDFTESLRQRVALFSGMEQNILQRVYDKRLRLAPGAETLLSGLRLQGSKTLLVTGGFSFFADRLKQRLHLDYTAASQLEIVDDKLTGNMLDIVDARGKAKSLQQVRQALSLRREQVLAIGDGANDLCMLREAGISVAFHAKPVLRQQATYAIDFGGLDAILHLFV